MLASKPQRQPSTPHRLGPRPNANDPMLVAVRRANIGAALEIERHRRAERPEPYRADPRVDALERQVEALQALVYELWERIDLPF